MSHLPEIIFPLFLASLTLFSSLTSSGHCKNRTVQDTVLLSAFSFVALTRHTVMVTSEFLSGYSGVHTKSYFLVLKPLLQPIEGGV